MRSTCLATVIAASLLSCDDSPPPASEPELTVNVAPLSLAGVTDTCFAIAVRDGASIVWSRTGLCSSRFGQGGDDLTFIGTCHAQPDGKLNGVDLVIESLFVNGTSPNGTTLPVSDWQNPCPVQAPCHIDAPCHADGNTPVTYNLTVVRSANQGFFDVAVTFEDLFCSAKVDCTSTDLLFAPDGTTRLPSAVLAFACTGGAASQTELYLDAALECGTSTVPLAIGGPSGNVYDGDDAVPAPLVQLATYRGVDALTDTSGAPYRNLYYNVALALDFDALDAFDGPCAIVATATASDHPFTPPYTTPANTVYPLIQVDVPLVASTSSTAYACSRHALGDGPEDGIWVDYANAAAPMLFGHRAHLVANQVVVDERRQCAVANGQCPAFNQCVDVPGDVTCLPITIGTSTPSAFGATQVGTSSAAKTVTVTATGTAALVVGSVTTTGDFSVTGNTCTTVAPGANCTITVVFSPTASGTRNGTLRIASNATATPTVVALSGIGFSDPLAINPTSITMEASTTTTFGASGGLAPYTFSVVSGGGSFSGAVYTAPASAGSAVVRVTDQLGGTSDASVVIATSSGALEILPAHVGHANIMHFDATRTIVAYSDSLVRNADDDHFMLRTIDRSGDLFSLGNLTRIDTPLVKATSDQAISLMGALGPSHFMMLVQQPGFVPKIHLFKMVGQVPTLVQTLGFGTTTVFFGGHPVDDTRYLLQYRENNSGQPIQYRLLIRTGDTLAFGTAMTRPSPSSFPGLDPSEPQSDCAIVRVNSNTFREIRSGYVSGTGYLATWNINIAANNTLSASNIVVHSSSPQKTLVPFVASDDTGNIAVLVRAQSVWNTGGFTGSTPTYFGTGTIASTSSEFGTQSNDRNEGFINAKFYIRLRDGNVYRWNTVTTAPTLIESGMPFSFCYHAASVIKSGNSGLYLTCLSQSGGATPPLRVQYRKY